MLNWNSMSSTQQLMPIYNNNNTMHKSKSNNETPACHMVRPYDDLLYSHLYKMLDSAPI